MVQHNFSHEDFAQDGAGNLLRQRLEKFADLSIRQRHLLATLEDAEEEFGPGDTLVQSGHPFNDILLLKQGWVLSKTHTGEDNPATFSIYLAGDLMGLFEIGNAMGRQTLTAATKVKVGRIPKRRFERVLRNSPRLSGLLIVLCSIDHSVTFQRMFAGWRNSALDRVSLFLLQTMSRLRHMNDQIDDEFHCPLTQKEIGDVTGLTSVHISKTLTRLGQEKLISRDKKTIRLLDESQLAAGINFTDPYEGLELSWLPEH